MAPEGWRSCDTESFSVHLTLWPVTVLACWMVKQNYIAGNAVKEHWTKVKNNLATTAQRIIDYRRGSRREISIRNSIRGNTLNILDERRSLKQ